LLTAAFDVVGVGAAPLVQRRQITSLAISHAPNKIAPLAINAASGEPKTRNKRRDQFSDLRGWDRGAIGRLGRMRFIDVPPVLLG
jgi:hypothetical protein